MQKYVAFSDMFIHAHVCYNDSVEGREGSQPGIAPKGELRAAAKSGGMMGTRLKR